MLVAVKKPPIEIRGDIPEKFIAMVREFFGETAVSVTADAPGDDDIITPENSTWFKAVEATMTPGKTMRHYREIHALTQEELGKKLGNVERQEISKMETGSRGISKKTAKQLAKIFDVSPARFI